jgi:hypothetical protein
MTMPAASVLQRLHTDQRGQTSAEYMGVILIIAAILAAVLLSGVGRDITEKIEVTLCRIAGGDCDDSGPGAFACPVRTTTSTDKLSVGVSVKLFSGEGSGERVVIKEEFDDGTARYTVIDKASLEVALGEEGAGAGILGVGGSLTARLAAAGVLENADIYETSDPDQTEDIDEALASSDGIEGSLRGVENALDAPTDLFNSVSPVDLPDVDGFLFDQAFGDADLPEPDSEYVGAEGGLDLSAGASGDQGPEEAGAEADLQAAVGGRHFTSGDRAGQTELYYRIEGQAGAELKSSILGESNVGASGELVATLVLDENGRPIILRVNGVGTVTGRNELGQTDLAQTDLGLTEDDLRELAIDSDETSGRTVEFTGELDLTDEENLQPVLDLLSVNPLDKLEGATNLVPQLAEGADVQYGIYDTEQSEDTTDTNLVVASLSTEDTEQVNTLRSLYRKPSGSTNFEQVDCDG